MKAVICWDTEPPVGCAIVEQISHFDARGMQRVYGRGDRFGRRSTFNLDIWKTRDGRLLMRCWSRREDSEWCSFEIKGVTPDVIEGDKTVSREAWVPEAVRKAYEAWILEEI